MRGAIWDSLFDNGFMPHGYCLLWDPVLFWTHAASDALVALSYFSIPMVLAVFAMRRPDFEFRWVLLLFSAFIICCGVTHVMGVWTLWVPSYRIEAVFKVATALVSATTAVLLWPLIPRILAIPSTRTLEERNLALVSALRGHEQAEAELAGLNRELEARVTARTADLEAKNEQLAGATRQAETANEAKSRFLSMMSHEIRTPLNAVITMSDLLMETDRSQTDRGYLRTIAMSSKALLAIVDDILDFSRIEAGYLRLAPVDTDVEEIIDEVVQSIAPLAHSKGLDIAVTIGPGVPETARVDGARIRQILLNLVGNAVNYTQSGWVHVELDLVHGPAGAALVFDVVDTGIGIPESEHQRIFERFSQAAEDSDGKASGTGLGLSISRRLAEAMDGTITVTSRPGQGSAFRLRLPVSIYGTSAPPPMHRADVALLGPPTRTKQSFAATLVGLGAGIRVIDAIEPVVGRSPAPTAALVVLPVRPGDHPTPSDWYELARSFCDRVVLCVPVGTVPRGLDALAADGVRIETYPMQRSAIADCLSGDDTPSAAGPAVMDDPLDAVRVLVVDDNEENRLVAERTLSLSGATATTAGDGATALRLLAREAFDVVLMDLRMPELDGYATARRIRALAGPAARVPIVAVSANITPETIGRIRAAGMDMHLAKPFRPRDLRAIVMRALGREQNGRGSSTGSRTGPTAGDARPTLDESFLSDCLLHTNAETVRTLIDGFLGGSEARLDAIASARHGTAGADALHQLAGAAGAVGATALADICKTEEQRIRSATGPGPEIDLAAIRDGIERAQAALHAYRVHLKAKE